MDAPSSCRLDDPRALDPAWSAPKPPAWPACAPPGSTCPTASSCRSASPRPGRPVRPPTSSGAAVQDACATPRGPVAVRSSSTWEDGATSAHAGATATVLDVEGADAVLDAIRHCLDASAEAQRSRDEPARSPSCCSGWCPPTRPASPSPPTRSPASEVVRIAATEGLGEALVQGEVVGSDVTVRGDTVDGDLAGLPTTSTGRGRGGPRDRGRSGRPQDIEWAVADGHVHVLQARPITVAAGRAHAAGGQQLAEGHRPLSRAADPVRLVGDARLRDDIRSVFDEMGLLIRGLEEAFVGGEIYGRVLPAFGSADSAGKPPPGSGPGPGRPGRARAAAPQRDGRQVRRAVQRQRWVDDWHRPTARDAAPSRRARAVDLPALDDGGLVQHLDACLALARRGQQIHFRLVMPLFHRMFRLHHLVGDELGWDDAAIAGMLAGHSPATRAAEDAMADLRQRHPRHRGAVAALAADPSHPVEALATIDADLAAELEAWIHEHGWALVNYDAGVPVLAERPTMITRLVLRAAPTSATTPTRSPTRAREALRAGPAGRRSTRRSQAARAIYPVREDNTIIVGDRPLALLRRWMLEVGRPPGRRGRLPAPADAAYLFLDELRAALAGDDSGDLTERILRRRGEEAWVRAHPGPAYVGEQAPPPDISRLPEPLRQVNEPILWVVSHEYPAPVEHPTTPTCCWPASPLRPASPRARCGSSAATTTWTARDGDVLVCQVTSPAWAPLFPLAAAVVADGGGALSHAAIAAREHGLPAVLGTGNGTATLQDGQRVRVDGTRGLVLECS